MAGELLAKQNSRAQRVCSFLFDIFLGPNYNHAPPSVKYMTANGGKYRFNPNLYADGKVCPSLLGTWSVPGCVSGKSTLLQVHISIQSMTLCEEPYLNEPGWANDGATPQSGNQMLGNLKNPPEPFGDVIRTHYRLKSQAIITQLDEWLVLDDGKATAGDLFSTRQDSSAIWCRDGFDTLCAQCFLAIHRGLTVLYLGQRATLAYAVVRPRVWGKLRARVARGETITLVGKDGVERSVGPSDVVGASEDPGVRFFFAVVLILDTPLEILGQGAGEERSRTEGCLSSLWYLSMSGVKGFKDDVHHIVASRDHVSDPITFTSAAFNQPRPSQLDSDIFPVPKYSLKA
ncbi:hypothetical protein DEU56DRAFT_912867 [Suillus clintonianus]|uniref:uncharacterized protein n=1 Tax=Suillus clintonianus TaxID=1904413 RepID=UPI001B8631AC|nr:uncharacterized protein DEU56DRAFT_912867 [Suillus clintonianus]KAG2137095.1 hypothetical protein DEU56DRAFT_912867 [Suillus clintonianus]